MKYFALRMLGGVKNPGMHYDTVFNDEYVRYDFPFIACTYNTEFQPRKFDHQNNHIGWKFWFEFLEEAKLTSLKYFIDSENWDIAHAHSIQQMRLISSGNDHLRRRNWEHNWRFQTEEHGLFRRKNDYYRIGTSDSSPRFIVSHFC